MQQLKKPDLEGTVERARRLCTSSMLQGLEFTSYADCAVSKAGRLADAACMPCRLKVEAATIILSQTMVVVRHPMHAMQCIARANTYLQHATGFVTWIFFSSTLRDRLSNCSGLA